MAGESEDERLRRESVYGQEDVVPEDLVSDLTDAPALSKYAIDNYVTGGSHRGTLSPAERLVVLHLSHGLTLGVIAKTLHKSPHTIERQVRTARAALNAKTREHLVAIALRAGLID